MRAAFVGKGGSGKTTSSGLLARYLNNLGHSVLAIDADINQHLATTLGMKDVDAASLPALGLEMKRIKEYLRGTNPRIESAADMIKTTPPGRGSSLLNLKESNPLFHHFSRNIGGIKLMAVGPFTEEDLGIRCYHSKTGAVELLLNHTIDTENEYIIVDMTAGSDSFASGLFTRFDITLLVVEPTIKSVSVYNQYRSYAKEFGVVIKAIGNKVREEDDIAFLRQHTGDDLITVLHESSFVRKNDRGSMPPWNELEEKNRMALSKIKNEIDAQKKDWKKFHEQTVYFHKRNAESWANSSAGKDLTTQIDPDFAIEP